MKISCALTASEIEAIKPNIVVFPEGVDLSEIGMAQQYNANIIATGAILENGRSRGILVHKGSNKIEYLKVETDGRTDGCNDIKQNPVYEFDDTCIGLLICMDIDNVEFSRAVIEKIRISSAKLKLLCVSADMRSHWLSDESLPPQKYNGVHVILCNHIKNTQDRCKSFITDAQCKKIVVQQNCEPIYAELP